MLRLSQIKPANTLFQWPLRMFGPSERQIERKYRKSHNERHLKDFTKHEYFRNALKKKEQVFKQK